MKRRPLLPKAANIAQADRYLNGKLTHPWLKLIMAKMASLAVEVIVIL